MPSCGPTSTTRARTGLETNPSGWGPGAPKSWPGCRPTYIMDRDRTMAETVAAEMPGEEETAACRWLPDAELAVYAREYERNGFQGGLQWYRCRTSGRFDREHELFSGRRIEVPACFIAGAADWGTY